MKPKNKYQQYIAIYNKRKETHEKILKGIRKKLKAWKVQIRRIEKREQRLRDIYTTVISYFGPIEVTKQFSISRSVFCKYCIEQGISGRFVAHFLKMNPAIPARSRRIFTRSIKDNPERGRLYASFLSYVKDNGYVVNGKWRRRKPMNRK